MNPHIDFPNVHPKLEMKSHENSVDCVQISPNDDNIAASGSHDHTLKLWDLARETATMSMTPHEEGVWNLDYHPNGNVVMSVSPASTVALNDAKSGKSIKLFKDHANKVYTARFNPAGTQFVTSDRDNNLFIWDYKQNKVIKQLKPPSNGFMFYCDYSPDGKYIVGTTFRNEIVVLDTTSYQFTDVQVIEPLAEHCDLGYYCRFSKTRPNVLLTGHEDHRIRQWELVEGGNLKLVETIEGHSGAVRSVIFNKNENRMISSCADHSLRIWDFDTKETLCILVGHTDIVAQCDVGKNTPIVVSAGWDQMVRVWGVNEYV